MIAYTDNLLSTCISTPASQFNIGSSCNRSIQPFQFNLLPSPLIAHDNALERGEKFHPVLVVEGWGFKEQMVSYAMSILIVSYRDDTRVSTTRLGRWTEEQSTFFTITQQGPFVATGLLVTALGRILSCWSMVSLPPGAQIL